MKGQNFTQCLFPEFMEQTQISVAKEKYKQRYELLKSKNFGMEHCHKALLQGKYGIPQIKKYTGPIPKRLVTLDEVNNIGSPTTGIVPFSYDYILDPMADNPELFAEKFSRYAFVGEPDLSMKVTDSLAVVIGNAFRSHSSAFYYQEHGCNVIPVMKWSTQQSYEVCFDGYEKGGIVMLSTIGVLQDERSRMYFINGFKEMLRRIYPDAVIIYGELPEWVIQIIPSQLPIYHFEHNRFKRLREYGK